MTEEIKKLIEEEARICVKNTPNTCSNLVEYGFTKGAQFVYYLCLYECREAERWRKVEDELPEVFGAGTSIPVLVKTKYGTYHVAVYSKPHDDFIEIPYSVAGVTEWKPIS